jgi:hypothetical protein
LSKLGVTKLVRSLTKVPLEFLNLTQQKRYP